MSTEWNHVSSFLRHGATGGLDDRFAWERSKYARLHFFEPQHRLQGYNPHGADVLLFAKGNNLLDENIRNSTSFLRNFAPESGRGAEIGVGVEF